MGVNGKQRSGVTFHDLAVVTSPRGDGGPRRGQNPCSENLPFNWDDLCWECGTAFNGEAHRSFVFYHSPTDIAHAEPMGGVPAEWRPDPDNPPIPGDGGPPRVAFWGDDGPTVQVHDGDDAGHWSPCSSYTVTREGMPYTMWICRRSNVSDPCDAEYLRSISS